MSHTIRDYHKRPLLGGPGLKGWIMSNLDDPRIVAIAEDWYIFRRYGAYCMGNCATCKRLKEKRYMGRRQADKRQLRELSWEYTPFGLYMGDYYTYDFMSIDWPRNDICS
ncbi:hypothetical protein M0R72_06835 [Candidatus Pacearchaeota archaeon]|jgi:hypothetical protein|nr:hypothetical protein [Candidatus Pacearchaeota archaeon]